jgi:hypothetical protein
VPGEHVGDERVDVIGGVERDTRLVLERGQTGCQPVLLEELQDHPHHVRRLHLERRGHVGHHLFT